MAGLTNQGVKRLAEGFFRRENLPATFYAALVTDDTPPTEDTVSFSELTEVAAGNGYSAGGQAVPASASGFDLVSVDTLKDEIMMTLADLEWTATGGPISNVAHLVLTDDNPTLASRQVLAYWSLGQLLSVASGSTLRLSDFALVGVVVEGSAPAGGGSIPVTPDGLIFHEKWDGSGYPLTYRDSTPIYDRSWSRALAIDQNGDSRIEPGAPLRSGEVVNGVSVGAEIIDFQGRKVLDLWCHGDGTTRDLGAKVPLVGSNNWMYDAWATWQGDVIYIRYYTYVPSIHMLESIGNWCTLGTQIKTTELYQSAGYQQNIETDWDNGGPGNFRFWHKHLDPTGGANTLLKQTTTEPKPALKVGAWQKHDLEYRMSYGAGYIKQWIDDVLVFENSGIMGDDPAASLPDVANFYVLLYGNIFTADAPQHLFIGDIMASTTSIR